MRTSIYTIVVALLASLALIVVAAAAAEKPFPYPFPPHDFAHPGSPHVADFSPAAGNRTVPTLVVYGTFTDVTEAPNVTTSSIASDMFPIGVDGTIADYFHFASDHRLKLVPAEETEGTTNDGVVAVSLGKNADFEGLFKSGGFAAQGRRIVEAADPYVDYAKFDKNGDGNITNDELAIVSIKTSNGAADNCGITDVVGDGDSLDGKNLSTEGWSDVVTRSNQMTIAHEIAHLLLGTIDNAYVSGLTDILGVTCNWPKDDFWLPNAYNRLHWGWVKPTIVERDGYYFGGPWLLYDPDHGTNDYFLAEHRNRGTYDEQSSDRGLVIWQVQDGRWGTPRGAFELVQPPSVGAVDSCGTAVNPNVPTRNNYCGSSVDAWDPTDSRTPARTMTNNWLDGTPAKAAVRAIHGRGGKVYFDVRGPGILVDTWNLTRTALVGATTPITFPVMNTGEQRDDFEFKFIDQNPLPSGFSQTSDVQTLDAGESGTASVQLAIAPDTPTGTYHVSALGRSTTSVQWDNPDGSIETTRPQSTDELTIVVEKRPVRLDYTGDSAADYSDEARVSARLTDGTTSSAIAGKPVTFTIGSQSATFTTDAAGVASGGIVLDQPAASTEVVVSFAGDGTYRAASQRPAFTVRKETLSLVYTGITLAGPGTVPTLSTAATEEADGRAGDLSRATVAFSLVPTLTGAPFAFRTSVGGDGIASVAATGLPVDLWTVTAAVPADNRYWRGGAAAPVELIVFDATALFTGNASGMDGAATPIAASFSAQYDRKGPKGSLALKFSGGTFSGSAVAWVVQVGNLAVFQVGGALNGIPAIVRMRVVDNGEPGRNDTFRATLATYDSGVVQVAEGNVKAH